jgi:D-alanyl-lipoteichoic acid acyltransferase DltB (MBOAT superfamily)
MLFNSVDFAIFLPLVFLLYWGGVYRKAASRSAFLLVVSYIFYGWWDWRFLILIALSSGLDFYIAQRISASDNEKHRRSWLTLSIGFNIGVLGFFKYANFFIDSFVSAFTLLGADLSPWSLQLILPVGISFYTFQTLSYTIDVYRKKIKATDDWLSFFAYVSFFPQLVAGPIERASSLLPQFATAKNVDLPLIRSGLHLMLWGFFKKLVVADNCGYWVDIIFAEPASHSSVVLLLGIVLFAFQIYGDFSGYSDIAIGIGRLFGFQLRRNFAYPYFSRDVAEFWRRWHISLSSWFRDYLYIPLGGSRGSRKQQVRNVLLVFLISGFWHGASWTFVIWGLIHATLFLPLILLGRNRRYMGTAAQGRFLPGIREGMAILYTFTLVGITWVFFRSDSVAGAFLYFQHLFPFTHFGLVLGMLFPLMAIGVLLSLEWMSREEEILFLFLAKQTWVRWSAYWVIGLAILLFSPSEPSVFIYFQF